MNAVDNLYIGIDPGKSGGIVGICDMCDMDGRLKDEHRQKVQMYKCGKNVDQMYESMLDLLFLSQNSNMNIYIMIEHVHSFPGQGVVSTFSFGQNYGRWEGIIAAQELYNDIVSPQKWMSYYNIPKGLPKKDRKKILKDKAQELFPEQKVTLSVSDALLIANYCRHIKKGEKNGL